MPLGETIVALATPNGQSAIALIRVSGPLTLPLLENIFKPSSPPTPRLTKLAHYIDSHNNTIDHVLYTYFPEKNSYSGEAMLEISSHGNPLITQKIIQDLLSRGCRLAAPGEFTRTAYLNGKLDLSQAEAVLDVIHAKSEAALRASQKQLSGELGKKINHFTDSLLQTLAEIEAYIDFPEEDLPSENSHGPTAQLKSITENFQTLIQSSLSRKLLYDGIKTLIVGPPNAGKSTLLNTLLGEERAIVSPEPGTTRDFISENIHIGPYALKIIDTAGIRSSSNPIEQQGIQKTFEKISQADFYLIVLDPSSPIEDLPQNLLSHISPSNSLLLLNKLDLHSSPPPPPPQLAHLPHIHLSLKTNQGLQNLLPQFQSALHSFIQQQGGLEEDIIINTRHANHLSTAISHLNEARHILQSKLPTEFASTEIRLAIKSLGEIIGQIDNERILDKLFSTFCIGK